MTVTWTAAAEYEDIRYETSGDGIAKITIDRPEVRNAFRPQTIVEISDALEKAREDTSVGVIVLTGEGPLAFCSGGDQRVRGDTGYVAEGAKVGRFHVTDLHVQIRRLPKPVVAMVAGYAVGGGHVLHLVCDLTIAADNARFGQTGPRVGSFDGGFGAALLADTVGVKKAKEIWFLCRQYDAQQALEMGLVNTVVPLDELEAETVKWCREMLELSPFSLRLLKASFHAAEDGLSGIQQLAHDANLLFYASDEAREGREAYKGEAQARLLAVPATTLSPLHIWLMAARPRTLPASVAPVLVGTALAATEGTFRPLTFIAAMLGAVFIQVGTNLSNDYSDARRGADTEDRLGPVRVTAGGLVPPRQVLVATYVAFGLAVLAGAYLIATAGWELLLIGVASILAGVLYTGGPRPYGYEGLGEVFVFLFFGVVAVTGSYFAQVERLTWEAFVLAVPVGLLASAILVVNNVRDLETDRRRASARWRCGSGGRARGRCSR